MPPSGKNLFYYNTKKKEVLSGSKHLILKNKKIIINYLKLKYQLNILYITENIIIQVYFLTL